MICMKKTDEIKKQIYKNFATYTVNAETFMQLIMILISLVSEHNMNFLDIICRIVYIIRRYALRI